MVGNRRLAWMKVKFNRVNKMFVGKALLLLARQERTMYGT